MIKKNQLQTNFPTIKSEVDYTFDAKSFNISSAETKPLISGWTCSVETPRGISGDVFCSYNASQQVTSEHTVFKSETGDLEDNGPHCLQLNPALCCRAETDAVKNLHLDRHGLTNETEKPEEIQNRKKLSQIKYFPRNSKISNVPAASDDNIHRHSPSRENKTQIKRSVKGAQEDNCFVQDPSLSQFHRNLSDVSKLITSSAHLKTFQTIAKPNDNNQTNIQVFNNNCCCNPRTKTENNNAKDLTLPQIILVKEEDGSSEITLLCKNTCSARGCVSKDSTANTDTTAPIKTETNLPTALNTTTLVKVKTKLIEEKFNEYKKENKAKHASVQKEFRITVANAQKVACDSRRSEQKKRARIRLENAARRRKLLRVKQSAAAKSHNSVNKLDFPKSSSKNNFKENENMEKSEQTNLEQLGNLERRHEQFSGLQPNQNIASDRMRSKSSTDFFGRFSSRRRKFDRYEIGWLARELHKLNLSEHANNLSMAFRKKEELELKLRSELQRENTRVNDLIRQVKQEEREQRKREAKRKQQKEKEKREKERQERFMAEEQKRRIEEQKRKERDKILLKNFKDSILNTSFSRSKTFSYFSFVNNEPRKQKLKDSNTAERYKRITARYKLV